MVSALINVERRKKISLMAKVIPFRAFLYSENLSPEISKLVSPPYDVISPKQHAALKDRHAYNSVQLCLVDDTQDPARYEKMQARYHDWKEKTF